MIANSSVVAAFAVSMDGRLVAANTTFAKLLGAVSGRDLVGTALTDVAIGCADWQSWRDASIAGREREVTVAFKGNGGQSITLRGDLLPVWPAGRTKGATPSCLSGIFVDVTEEKKLRNAVQRSARMEALGSLTSGIAHDFNNLLTVLVGNLYLAAEELRDQPRSFAKLKSARDAAKRGADLIRQLLSFAKREAVDAEVVDPAKVIEGLVPLLRRALGARINLSARLEPNAGLTRCNAAQLESVIVNLSVNARDAIENGGSIEVSCEWTQLSAEAAAAHRLESGDYLRITVADDGAGIPQETLNRVFEPFFTTKGDRGGTGLGLSMVRWFTEQAGGAVHIDSAPGRGTRVSLLLPASSDKAAETSAKTMPLSTLPSGSESILIFAREESLRSTIKQILEVLGYEVHLCAEPAETLNAVRTRNVDLLLIDAAAQPAPAQKYLLREAVAAKPGLKLIVATDAGDSSRARLSDGVAVINKPFSIADLAGTLRNVLQERPAGR